MVEDISLMSGEDLKNHWFVKLFDSLIPNTTNWNELIICLIYYVIGRNLDLSNRKGAELLNSYGLDCSREKFRQNFNAGKEYYRQLKSLLIVLDLPFKEEEVCL